MKGIVKFKREKNRTAEDIFRNMVMPRLPLAMNVVSQKVVHFNKNNHQYENRTGALEESITWTPAEIRGNKVVGAIIAGGESKAKYTYVRKMVFYYDEQRRLRVFKLKEPEVITKGTLINVNYAIFVENMGMPVLKQGIEKYKSEFVRLAGRILKSDKTPRMYKFKYSGEIANIRG